MTKPKQKTPQSDSPGFIDVIDNQNPLRALVEILRESADKS